MLPVIAYPTIDPVLVEIGPFVIRWYALAYITGLLLGWAYIRRLVAMPPHTLNADGVADLLFWTTIGILLGGRLGFVLFYRPDFYLANPLEVLFLWRGGMSFHGGLIGVFAALLWFTHSRKITLLAVTDLVAAAAPIGLFLGRMANFINGELFGRVSEVPWAMVFPGGGPWPRHPSQIYEAGLEGIALFAILFLLVRYARARQREGLLTGAFLLCYSAFRSMVELVREPDAYLGFLPGGLTMGQTLSFPMALLGVYLVIRSLRAP
jgi:phosphatidylglycerol:prolipoprotein diacylglycerol transferase